MKRVLKLKKDVHLNQTVFYADLKLEQIVSKNFDTFFLVLFILTSNNELAVEKMGKKDLVFYSIHVHF